MYHLLSCSLRSALRRPSQPMRSFASAALPKMDPTQKDLLKEGLILIDEQDQIIGTDTKENCHRMDARGNLKLHRALSVLLFNARSELLLTKRSKHKLWFPNKWTNTVCSHPNFTPMEYSGTDGARRAAIRRLKDEIGVDTIREEDLVFLTRFQYSAINDEIWGENELSHIFYVKKDVYFRANRNEVGDERYVGLQDIEGMDPGQFTPWFRLFLTSGLLRQFWEALDNPKKKPDPLVIHRHMRFQLPVQGS